MFKFAAPYFLILIPVVLFLFLMKRKKQGIEVPGIEPIKNFKLKKKISYWKISYSSFIDTDDSCSGKTSAVIRK